jgi:Fic family protein
MVSAYDSIRKMWRAFHIDSEQDLDRYLDNFRILFAYHSGRIENDEITFHDTREIFENGKVLNFTGSPRSILEQQNQKLCYEYLKKKIIRKESITVELVKDIHRILAAGTYDEQRYVDKGERPWEFKKHDYITGIHEVGSTPGQVQNDLADLLLELNDYTGGDILKSASYFHARFEYIHPFADGNGRVGRTLLNYYLLTHGEPPLIIYDEDKDQYYRALEKYDSEELLQPILDFFFYETEKTWKETFDRSSGKLQSGRKQFKDMDH